MKPKTERIIPKCNIPQCECGRMTNVYHPNGRITYKKYCSFHHNKPGITNRLLSGELKWKDCTNDQLPRYHKTKTLRQVMRQLRENKNQPNLKQVQEAVKFTVGKGNKKRYNKKNKSTKQPTGTSENNGI